MTSLPVMEVTRGGVVESVHHGSIAVADPDGRLLASWGDPHLVTFLRSSAKPFQALPVVELGVAERHGLNDREIALICASHAGTEEHVHVLFALLRKIGASEADLDCGTHPPFDREAARKLQDAGEDPAPRHHNCSGKHSGMLALSAALGATRDGYVDPSHPVQQTVLATFAGMCGLPADEVAVGIDGCSAPNFAVPLHAAATAYARLAAPAALAPERAKACSRIFAAMTQHPLMVSGPGRFDTRIMEALRGRLVSKGGAEGYQAFGLPAETLGNGSPACGVALKIVDGNLGRRAGEPVALEALRQLGAIGPNEMRELADMTAPQPLKNHRGAEVGELRTCFSLNREA